MRPTPIPALADNYIWRWSDEDSHTLIVDPGESEPVLRILEREKLTLTTILLTHHHADHIGGVKALMDAFDCTVYGPVDERIAHVHHRVGEGDRVHVAQPAAQFEVMEIPGHTRSHIAYVGEGLVFCGDTLFSLGCGRLFDGTPAQMLASLDRLAALPADTWVCCAHEYTRANATFATTIEPHNRDLEVRREQVRQLLEEGRPTVPSRMREECAANPFLRVGQDSVASWCRRAGVGSDDRVACFAALRDAKDHFRA